MSGELETARPAGSVDATKTDIEALTRQDTVARIISLNAGEQDLDGSIFQSGSGATHEYVLHAGDIRRGTPVSISESEVQFFPLALVKNRKPLPCFGVSKVKLIPTFWQP